MSRYRNLSLAKKLYGSFWIVLALLAMTVLVSHLATGWLSVGLVPVALVLGIGIAIAVTRDILRSVALIRGQVQKIAEGGAVLLREGLEAFAAGDLTHRLTPSAQPLQQRSRDELGMIVKDLNVLRERLLAAEVAYNQTGDQLQGLVSQIASDATSVRSVSEQMAASSQQSGAAMSEIAGSIAGVAEGSEHTVQVMAMACDNARKAVDAVSGSIGDVHEAAAMAAEAHEAAEQGIAAAAQATEAMTNVRESSQAVTVAIGELSAKSQQIGSIVETITGIAEQTNLLALNAAIEAARAGERGRGFAVVADEVRKLAEESQHAAQEIGALIDHVQHETERAVDVVQAGRERTELGAATVERTRTAFTQIGDVVRGVGERIERITTFAEGVRGDAEKRSHVTAEVATLAERASASAQQVSTSTEQTSAAAQQIAASAQDLASSAEGLNRLVARFKV